MKRKMKNYVPALLAGAAMAGLGIQSGKAAITYSAYAGGTETLNGTTYTAVEFFLTGFTAPDNATVNGHAPSLISLDGEFQATGGATLFVPGNSTSGDKANWTNFITPAGEGLAYTSTGGSDSSYVNFPNITSGFSRTGTGTGTASTTKSGTTYSSLTGTSVGFGDTTGTGVNNEWYDGGSSSSDILPGAANQSLASAFFLGQASAPNLIAYILVSGTGGVAYNGSASTYVSNGESANMSFSQVSGVTTGAQKVISLLTTASTGTAPAGYGNNPIATLAVSPNGKATSVTLTTPATSGYVTVTGTPAPYYALSLDVNGAAATASALQAIVGDINNNSTGVTATYLSSAGGAFGSGFASPNGAILLSDSVTGGTQYFSFDFSSSGSDLSDADSALGPVTVVAIAAVPEPATAAGIIIGASGLLLGRRRGRTATA